MYVLRYLLQRKMFRKHDEHIKNAPEFATQKNAYSGTALLGKIFILFDELEF